MTGKYTEKDFTNARFAEHEDGRLAHRKVMGPDRDIRQWTTTGDNATGQSSDASMARDGWVPVSGQTMTESELIAAVDETNHEDMNEYQKAYALLVYLGYTIPKPTNAKRLEADLTDWYAKNADARPTLTDHLIERGWVKALGGDDDR